MNHLRMFLHTGVPLGEVRHSRDVAAGVRCRVRADAAGHGGY
ncbi:hypothetical protein OH723_29360 [Streptomyces albidoflavus]|nr:MULTISPECIES: hypothetical protein [Streptomyces]WTC39172.1 hypothetical protein OH723_29360 [Streptomyces albidoflavus]WTE00168.1 hypothetical protein OG950_28955 [Streptomyces albidoflavus]